MMMSIRGFFANPWASPSVDSGTLDMPEADVLNHVNAASSDIRTVGSRAQGTARP
jgi:hypothetical protein